MATRPKADRWIHARALDWWLTWWMMATHYGRYGYGPFTANSSLGSVTAKVNARRPLSRVVPAPTLGAESRLSQLSLKEHSEDGGFTVDRGISRYEVAQEDLIVWIHDFAPRMRTHGGRAYGNWCNSKFG